ncbi:hypothetical protein Sjap_005185 [Stephania japonica]|uniref:Uncharacterized protein n=1 Tax=Stephania japonica TaxID=461633 RepID=A0AAP0PIH9_9MAGN
MANSSKEVRLIPPSSIETELSSHYRSGNRFRPVARCPGATMNISQACLRSFPLAADVFADKFVTPIGGVAVTVAHVAARVHSSGRSGPGTWQCHLQGVIWILEPGTKAV